MRNVLAVLVPLCIGLTSGFIVPSGIQELKKHLKGKLNTIHSNGIKTKNMVGSKQKNQSEDINISTTSTTSMKQVVRNSLDTEMFNQSEAKDTEVKERSFVYINRRGKYPVRNRYHDNPIRREEIDNNNYKAQLLNIHSVYEDIPRRFSIGLIGDEIFNIIAEISDKPYDHAKMKNYIKSVDTNSKTNKQREYFQPLKAPLLRVEDIDNLDESLLNDVTADLRYDKLGYEVFTPSAIENINLIDDDMRHIKETVPSVPKVRDEVLSSDGSKEKYNQNIANDDNSISKQNLNEIESERKHILNLNYSDLLCKDFLNKVRKHKLNSRQQIEKKCNYGRNKIRRELENIKV